MPLDELGVDPYQRAAVTFARRMFCVFVVMMPTGVACYHYGQTLGTEGDRLSLVGLSLMVLASITCVLGYQRLRSENLEYHMLCLPGP